MVHVGMPSAGRGAANVRCPKSSVCVYVCQCVCMHVLNKAAASGANVLPAVKHLLVSLNQVVGAQRNLRRASQT